MSAWWPAEPTADDEGDHAMRFTMKIGAALLLAGALVTAIPQTATAAPPGTAPAAVGAAPQAQAGMTVGRVVRVTESAGARVLTLADGPEIRLSAAEYAQWAKTEVGLATLDRIANGDMTTASDPIKFGSCGMTYLYLEARGGQTVEVLTGYALINVVLYSRVYVDVFDRGGASERFYYAGFNNGEWGTTELLGGMTPGYAWAQIGDSSYAVLGNGNICYSLTPWDDTDIW